MILLCRDPAFEILIDAAKILPHSTNCRARSRIAVCGFETAGPTVAAS